MCKDISRLRPSGNVWANVPSMPSYLPTTKTQHIDRIAGLQTGDKVRDPMTRSELGNQKIKQKQSPKAKAKSPKAKADKKALLKAKAKEAKVPPKVGAKGPKALKKMAKNPADNDP